MKRIIMNIICCIGYLVGVLLFAWPDIRGLVSEQENQVVIQEFEEIVNQRKAQTKAPEDDKETSASDAESEGEALPAASDELLWAMKAYNTELYETGQTSLEDPWSYETESLDLTQYGIYNNLIGILTVPKMDLELPIYLGANKTNMAKGAALLGQTSFPLTGENVNAVLAAHRGWRGIPMFREIQKLELGDRLTIRNYWETLTYQVTDIKVVLPYEVDNIFIQPGKNRVTLITCHPYTKNSHRYVVCCELVGENMSGNDGTKSTVSGQTSDNSTGSEKSDGENNSSGLISSTDSTLQESAEQTREAAIAEDKETMDKEKKERIIGYIVIAILGVVAAYAMFGTGRKNKKSSK